jgi:Flp pilus assembly protein TadG
LIRRRDAGSVSVELTLLAPVVLVLLLFTVGLGRIEDAHGQVTGAARDAARAASLAADPATATSSARQAAAADVAGVGLDCRNLTVQVDTRAFAPGGAVTVRVACTADLADLALTGLPGRKTLTATSTAPVESYRSVTP